uniref:Uncharacterized protein n=1 Tax=Ditylenchus dipsaci TaxID=166011 RepID=A0A915CNW5_9BILA
MVFLSSRHLLTVFTILLLSINGASACYICSYGKCVEKPGGCYLYGGATPGYGFGFYGLNQYYSTHGEGSYNNPYSTLNYGKNGKDYGSYNPYYPTGNGENTGYGNSYANSGNIGA